MYKKHILSLSLLSFMLTSCMTQPSAPIDYGTSNSTINSSPDTSDSIVETPIIREKTTWGNNKEQKEEENYYPNVNPDTIPDNPDTTSVPIRTKPISHEVIEGETVDSIAKQYDITREALIKANNLKAPFKLEELQILTIPPQVTESATNEPLSVGDIINPTPFNSPQSSMQQNVSTNLPVDGTVISRFGEQNLGVKNNGINIEAPIGSDIHSESAGQVVYSGTDPKFGNLVIVKSDNEEIFMAYSHMNDLIVKKGDSIAKGQILGHVGQTGNVESPQLHFAVRNGKIPVDPQKYLQQ